MELPKRKQNRLTEYDYSTPNAYFITICTADRKNLFWKNVGAATGRPESVPLSPYGKIADDCIKSIPVHYPSITIDRYVVMPNHIHLLLRIHSDSDGRPMANVTKLSKLDFAFNCEAQFFVTFFKIMLDK